MHSMSTSRCSMLYPPLTRWCGQSVPAVAAASRSRAHKGCRSRGGPFAFSNLTISVGQGASKAPAQHFTLWLVTAAQRTSPKRPHRLGPDALVRTGLTPTALPSSSYARRFAGSGRCGPKLRGSLPPSVIEPSARRGGMAPPAYTRHVHSRPTVIRRCSGEPLRPVTAHCQPTAIDRARARRTRAAR